MELFRPERKKTAHAFHAKDDLPEVRYRVFSMLRAEASALRFHAVVCDKQVLTEQEKAKLAADGVYRYQPNALYPKNGSWNAEKAVGIGTPKVTRHGAEFCSQLGA